MLDTNNKGWEEKILQNRIISKKTKRCMENNWFHFEASPKPITASPDDLNNYSSDIAESLTGKSPETIYKNNVPDEIYNIFTLKESNYIEIRKEFKQIRNGCSAGFDCVPPELIKPVSDYLASPLMHIINNCIKVRKFPKLWKTVKICPVPKISSPTTNSDYRPISILPILSKIFERIILSQLKVTLEQHHVLNDTQSGYRQGHYLMIYNYGLKKVMLHW